MRFSRRLAPLVLLAGLVPRAAGAADPPAPLPPPPTTDQRLDAVEKKLGAVQESLEQLAKATDDVLWFERLGDVAEVTKLRLTGPPNPRGQETYGIKHEHSPLVTYAYLFVPRALDRKTKHPLLVFPHGGVHGNFDTTAFATATRELLEDGYVVLAPEFRGSTGYGPEFREAIDYGGLEVDDCIAARDWAVDNLAYVDGQRAGILGWSHGGLIALLAVFDHPEKFRVAYAGFPVSDLLARMGSTDDEYRAIFSAKTHLGKTANQDVDAYRRRSPAWNAQKLKTPLLVHTATNDQDVSVAEVEHLITALRAEKKDFRSKIYQDPPGGHCFNLLDTRLARESRREIREFLAGYLEPAAPRASAVVFENERVRVLHNVYAPHEEVPQHAHPARLTVAVVDCKVRSIAPDGTAREIAIPAGAVTWFEPTRHALVNLADAPFEMVEIEFKAARGPAVVVPQRTPGTAAAPPEPAPVEPVSVDDEPLHRWLLENQYVRVLDVRIPPGATTKLHRHALDAVAVRLGPASVASQDDGAPWSAPVTIARGETAFDGYARAPRVHRVRNVGPGEFHTVLVQLLPQATAGGLK